MMHSDKQRYVQELKQRLVCSRKARKMALGIFENAYADAAPPADCTYDDIAKLFGTPQEVAEEYLEHMTPAEKRHISRKTVVLSILLVLAVIIIGFCIYVIKDQQEVSLGTIRETSAIDEPVDAIVSVYEEE